MQDANKMHFNAHVIDIPSVRRRNNSLLVLFVEIDRVLDSRRIFVLCEFRFNIINRRYTINSINMIVLAKISENKAISEHNIL